MSTTPVRETLLIPESVEDVPSLRRELNLILTKLQGGGVLLGGLKLDTQRTTAPTVAPEAGTPNVVVINVSGTLKMYVWDGSSWVVVGTQT